MRRLLKTAQRGNAAVEFALLLPVLVLIVCGAVDFSRIFHAYVTVASTAHEAARYAARFPGAEVAPAAMQTAIASESQGFVKLGVATGGNATLVGPSIEGLDEQVAKVTLTYLFDPVSPLPLSGPIPINVNASAPTGGAGGVPTSTPVATPTVTRTPTVTPTPSPTVPPTATTPIAMCNVPNFVNVYSLNGNTARDAWVLAGFAQANFSKHENNGTVRSQNVPAGPAPCLTTAITLHDHV